MSDALFRLVHCSRNTLCATADPGSGIDRILATSRANGARAGVAGALIDSGGCFAQALEAPLTVVQSTFECRTLAMPT